MVHRRHPAARIVVSEDLAAELRRERTNTRPSGHRDGARVPIGSVDLSTLEQIVEFFPLAQAVKLDALRQILRHPLPVRVGRRTTVHPPDVLRRIP